jgi:hypothetical protein
MQVENKERWMKVCAQIAEEQDRHALIELVDELNYLLEEKAKKLGIVRGESSECLQRSAAVH